MFAAGELRRNWIDGIHVGDIQNTHANDQKISLHDVKFPDEPTSTVID
jgi:hypothetical protein